MRRLSGVLIIATLMVTGTATAASAAAAAPGHTDAPKAVAPVTGDPIARGLVMAGLRRAAAGSRCGHGFELVTSGRCTHGPDPAPANVDVRFGRGTPVVAQDTSSSPGTAAATSSTVPCYGDGTSGNRVEAIYAHAADVSDRYSSLLPSIRQWAAQADDVFNQSAAETGGVRHIRFVTDAGCNITVTDVQLSSTGDDSIDNTVRELQNLGFKRSDRKYLVWMDAGSTAGSPRSTATTRRGRET